jgi:hypothetical protein
VALKLVGVPGRKLSPGKEDTRTQDFTFIQTPALPFQSPDELVTFVRVGAQSSGLMMLPRLIGALGLGRTLAVFKGLGALPKVASMAGVPFHTAAPLRCGPFAAKLALVPLEPAPVSAPPRSPDALREELITRLRSGPLSWSLRVQLFLDEQTTPIEDASVVWPEDRSPFHEVARLVLPQQDVSSPAGMRLEAQVERMGFAPWQAVEELRPLGAMMRSRASSYRDSMRERQAAPEPEGMAHEAGDGSAAA